MVPIIENPRRFSDFGARDTRMPSLCGDERQFSVQHYQDGKLVSGSAPLESLMVELCQRRLYFAALPRCCSNHCISARRRSEYPPNITVGRAIQDRTIQMRKRLSLGTSAATGRTLHDLHRHNAPVRDHPHHGAPDAQRHVCAFHLPVREWALAIEPTTRPQSRRAATAGATRAAWRGVLRSPILPELHGCWQETSPREARSVRRRLRAEPAAPIDRWHR